MMKYEYFAAQVYITNYDKRVLYAKGNRADRIMRRKRWSGYDATREFVYRLNSSSPNLSVTSKINSSNRLYCPWSYHRPMAAVNFLIAEK